VAGGIKLLLRCLQSIQCQYYLVFGVVKTVPLQSFARLRFPFRPSTPIITASFLALRSKMSSVATFATQNGSTTSRTVIDTYILHLLSLRSFLIIYTACVRVSSSFTPRDLPRIVSERGEIPASFISSLERLAASN